MREARYFFAMFGDPKPPGKDTVEYGSASRDVADRLD